MDDAQESGLPFAILLSLLLVPPAALLSGCGAAALLQWVGDRLGVLRGRLAVVGVVSVVLSFLTYALVIFPIIVGMGFFSVAAYSFLSASALLVLPQLDLPSPPWWISAAGYSLSDAVKGIDAPLSNAPFPGFPKAPTDNFYQEIDNIPHKRIPPSIANFNDLAKDVLDFRPAVDVAVIIANLHLVSANTRD